MLQWSFVTLSINNKGVKQQIYVHYKIDFVHAPTGYFESFGTNTHCLRVLDYFDHGETQMFN